MVDSAHRLLDRIHAWFNEPRLRRGFLVMRAPLSILAGALLLWHGRREWFWIGLAVSAVGEALQLWCFACIDTRRTLATSGPYSLVRNPMYLARYVLLLGMVLWTGRWWVVVAFTGVYYFYMVNRVRREEALLKSLFGDAYGAYCAEVPRFLPRWRRIPWRTLRGAMRADNFRRQHGLWNAVAVIAIYLLAYGVIFRRH